MSQKLSSNVLKMKFMKKSREKSEFDAEEEDRRKMFSNEISDALLKESDQCIIEPSFIPCEKLRFGRFSFKGMNPEIEKLMEENEHKDLNKLKKMDGISDKEMAYRYTSLIDTMGKNFIPKRKRNINEDSTEVSVHKTEPKRKSLKFRRPREDF